MVLYGDMVWASITVPLDGPWDEGLGAAVDGIVTRTASL